MEERANRFFVRREGELFKFVCFFLTLKDMFWLVIYKLYPEYVLMSIAILLDNK